MVSDTPARNGDASSVIDAFLGAGPGNLPLSYERLHIDVSGPESAHPVVVLHGWGSSARLMSPVAATLSSDFFVHNIDMPGHGLSPQPPAPCGLEEQASLVRQYIEDKLSPPVILFGHSNGGRIGLYLASRPDTAHLIDKLVLVSPSGIRPNRGPAYYFKSNLAKLLKLPTRFLRGRFKEHVMDWLTHSLVWKMLGSSDYNALTGTMRQSFVATVSEIARVSDPVTGLFDVELRFDAAPVGLVSGLIARIELSPAAGVTHTLTYIPIGALVQADGNRASVFVVADDTARKRDVEVAFIAADSVALAAGVAPGDAVVSDGALYLDDGEHIRILATGEPDSR